MNLLMVGCGKMGLAALQAIVFNNVFSKIIVIQPSLSAKEYFLDANYIEFLSSFAAIPLEFIPDCLLIAIKPQQFNTAMLPYTKYRSAVIVSLMAGIRLEQLSNYFASANIVRIMPNLAISVRQGLSFAVAMTVLEKDKRLVSDMFLQTGSFLWLDDESMLDKLTPISGSGPAYFFLLAEILMTITEGIGLPAKEAAVIAQQTLLGAAALASSDADFIGLKKAVASKGGITQAALSILEPALASTMEQAIAAATKRMEELYYENRN